MARIRSWYGNGASAGTVAAASTALTSIGPGDSPFDQVTGTVNIATSGTRQPRLSFPAGTAIQRVGWTIPSVSGIATSFTVNLSGLPPSQNTALVQGLTTGGTAQSFRAEFAIAGNLVLRNAANTVVGTSAAALSAATDYYVELIIDAAGNATLTAYLLDTATVAASTSGAVGTTHDTLRYGTAAVSGTSVPSWSLDEIRVFDVASTSEPVADQSFYQWAQRPPGFLSPATQLPALIGDQTTSTSLVLAAAVSDSAPATDTTTANVTSARTLSDTGAGTDTVARVSTYARTTSDSAPATDAVVRLLGNFRPLSNSAPATDSVAAANTRARALSEAVGGTDSVARALVQARSLSNSAPATDATAVTNPGANRSVSDSAPATDTTARALVQARTFTNPTGGTDSLARALVQGRAESDAAGGTDATSRSTARARALSDSAPAVDTQARTSSRTRAQSDSAPATDAVVRSGVPHPRALSDSAPATDGTATGLPRFRSQSDSAPATDGTVRSPLSPARSQSDSAPATDTATRTSPRARALSDSAPATDATVRAVKDSRATSNSAPATDTTTAGTTHAATTSESAPATDTNVRRVNLPRALTESAPAVDTVLVGIPITVDDPEASLAANLHRAVLTPNGHYADLERNLRRGTIMDTYVQGDLLPDLTCVLYDGNKPFDATGATSVTVKVWVNDVLLLTRPADTVSADGTVTLVWHVGETNEPGPFKVRVVAVYGSKATTFPANGYMVGNIHPASP